VKHVDCNHGKAKEECIQVLVGTHEGTRLLGRPSCRSEDTIKQELEKKVEVLAMNSSGRRYR
jgi:hypothetical protein